MVFINYDIAFALERAVTVMVIACSHALGLAIPLVIARSTAIAALNGFLIRNRVAFEKAKDINAIVLDKTGTLTKGIFGVTDVILLNNDIDETKLISLATSLEQYSEHPIARSIVEFAKERRVKLLEIKEFKATSGIGVKGLVSGNTIMIVGSNYLKEMNISIENGKVNEVLKQGKTVVYVMFNGNPIGAIALADMIRDESKEAIKNLKELGIKTIMLTSDNKLVAS